MGGHLLERGQPRQQEGRGDPNGKDRHGWILGIIRGVAVAAASEAAAGWSSK